LILHRTCSVLVPDLFRGNPWRKSHSMDGFQQWLAGHSPARVSGDIDACTQWLLDELAAAGESKKLGVVGFCYGGGQVVEALARDAEKGAFSAGVCFYGSRMDASLGDRTGAVRVRRRGRALPRGDGAGAGAAPGPPCTSAGATRSRTGRSRWRRTPRTRSTPCGRGLTTTCSPDHLRSARHGYPSGQVQRFGTVSVWRRVARKVQDDERDFNTTDCGKLVSLNLLRR
jgi:dienelactone hydrolase